MLREQLSYNYCESDRPVESWFAHYSAETLKTQLCCSLQRRKESWGFFYRLTHLESCRMQRASHTIHAPFHGLISIGSVIRSGSKDSNVRFNRSYCSSWIEACGWIFGFFREDLATTLPKLLVAPYQQTWNKISLNLPYHASLYRLHLHV